MPNLACANGVSLYYELLEEDNSGPWLVFLHEGLGCCAMWRDFPRRLCARTGLPGLLYDRQGYGNSSPATGARTIHYLHDSGLRELPLVLEQLIPERDYILIGHSDGGSIALIHGAERPPRLRGLITEAAHVFVDPLTISGIEQAQRAWEQGKLAGLRRFHGERTEAVFRAWAGTWLSDWFGHWNIEYLLPSIDAPLLVLQGAEDQYGTRAQVETIAAGVAGRVEKRLVPGCGHIPHREDQETVSVIVGGFLDSIVGRQG